MSYIIRNTNNDALITVVTGTTDDTYSITLIGQNFTSTDTTSWGQIQNDNFIKLLEEKGMKMNDTIKIHFFDGKQFTTENLKKFKEKFL